VLPGLLWLGIALGIVGVGIVIAGIRGRRSGWLGTLAVIGLVISLPWTANVSSDGPTWTVANDARDGVSVGTGTVVVQSVREAQRGYRVQFGDATIDLTQLDLSGATADNPVTVPVSLAAGNLVIELPRGIAVEAEVRIGAGQVTWQVDGQNREVGGIVQSTRFISQSADDGDGPVLKLSIDGGAGQVTVTEVAR
jgi:hypothetical protein